MDNGKIIESIKDMCRNNNITVTKLEEELGMSQGLVGRWAKSDPSLSKIVDIAEYFHVSLDEVVGFHDINDKFLEKLIKQTAEKTIKWNKYNKNTHEQPLHYYDSDMYADPGDFMDEKEYYDFLDSHKEISYFVTIKNVYISLYAFYKYQNILNPFEIKLFIQPDDNAQLIEQNYSYEQLKVLWLKVLYTLGENAPDEIKAEEFKTSFINDFKKPEPLKKKSIIVIPRESIKRPPNTIQPRPQNQKPIKRPIKPITPLTPPKSINKLDDQQNVTPKDNEQ